MNPPPYDELDAGIRDVVERVNRIGFETTDSGDGRSKAPEDRAFDVPHIVCRVDKFDLIFESRRLADLLGSSWHVEGTFCPNDDSSLMIATMQAAVSPLVPAPPEPQQEGHWEDLIAAAFYEGFGAACLEAMSDAPKSPRESWGESRAKARQVLRAAAARSPTLGPSLGDWRLVKIGEVGPVHGGHGSWVESDHPAIVACMGSAPECIAGGCQYRQAKANP